jgi:protein-disulfide isomerase
MLLGFGIGAMAFCGVARADSFTPEQRAEIVGIVRDALKQDPSILRDAVAALQADESAKTQQNTQAALARLGDSLIAPTDPVAGNPKGDVTIVEFFDTRCPYCRRLEPAMASLLAEDKGVRLVFKDLPILGPASMLGARALLAAQRQGGYEKLRTALMQPGFVASDSSLAMASRTAGLDWPRLKQDMDDPAIERRLSANLAQAHALGIEGTPALIVGTTLIPGAVELADLRRAVAQARADK